MMRDKKPAKTDQYLAKFQPKKKILLLLSPEFRYPITLVYEVI